ncbi:ArnT family glycosyltransferase [Crossiella cryophila]|uniref:4-amino-4-deoxy-L-arabinose transferase-like glycosyltransferase n=1 Tax=Crossiella cryophila TaxID=43355 RepID=A0A7W7FXL2_9PSEU|nr:glycosyltransferase family 39 protein [Crossiella cryophila]MBB4679059.1 4-amino-4-deoxy-L-arabinose transferase-like glycosyltransferase [Crossiella cryophila]
MNRNTIAVTVLTLATFGLTFWAAGSVEPHYYYTVAVRAMSADWHAFLYGAIDPAGTLTVDKIPGALWAQALSVRLFGFHDWALLLPQALAAAATVPLLHDAVRRWAGTRAGLLAALVFALTPITVVLARVNIPDTLLVLALVGGAHATILALRSVRTWPLILAGIWVGLGFQVKLGQALLVLPALAIPYLVKASVPVRARIARVLLAGLTTAVVACAWLVLVALTPAAHRPYVDGSTANSVWDMAFRYNGLGRFVHTDAASGQVASFLADFGGPPGLGRLANAELGTQIAWLLPFAVLALVAGLVFGRRHGSTVDGWLLWGLWLGTHAVVFSAATGIHPYYAAALTPAIAALSGAGLVLLARLWSAGGTTAWLLPLGVAVTGAWAAVLSARAVEPSAAAEGLPGLTVLVLGLTTVTVVVLVVGALHPLPRLRIPAIGGAVLVLLAAPAVWSVEASGKPFPSLTALNPVAGPGNPLPAAGMAAMHGLPPDTPLPPELGDMHMVTPNRGLLSYVGQRHRGEKYLLAVPTVNTAAPYLRLGHSVLPMGGFTGAAGVPALSELDALVRTRALRFVMIGGFHGGMGGPIAQERQRWVAEHCLAVPFADYQGPSGPPDAPETLYDCQAGAR